MISHLPFFIKEAIIGKAERHYRSVSSTRIDSNGNPVQKYLIPLFRVQGMLNQAQNDKYKVGFLTVLIRI
jgi:hypothetical protein